MTDPADWLAAMAEAAPFPGLRRQWRPFRQPLTSVFLAFPILSLGFRFSHPKGGGA